MARRRLRDGSPKRYGGRGPMPAAALMARNSAPGAR